MTAGTNRNGTGKFGRFGWSSARPGAPDRQARGNRDEIEFGGRTGDSYFAHDGQAAQGSGTAETSPDGLDYGGYDWDAVYHSFAHEVYGGHRTDEANDGHLADAGFAGDAGHAGDVGHAGDADREPKRGRKAEKYTGRHASPRHRTARKRRVGKVVPVAAAAATLAAGTAAAYALGSGGLPQAAQLNAAMMSPVAAVATPSVGQANAGASSLVKVAQATASGGSRAAAKPAATASPSSAPAKSSAASTPSASATTQAPAPAATASQPTAASAATLSCDLNYSMLPENVTAIVSFLLANGYSDNAAAGIAGNIYQESGGDPESIGTGGGGLIGWTPLPSGFVTGDVSADLQYQLSQILVYNQQWSSYIPELNAAATPSDAAYVYVTDFERAGIPAYANREGSAEEVASACDI